MRERQWVMWKPDAGLKDIAIYVERVLLKEMSS